MGKYFFGVYLLAGLLLNNPKLDACNRAIAKHLLESIYSSQEVKTLIECGSLTFPKAVFEAGYLLIGPDPARGLHVLKTAADQGSSLAMCLLAEWYLSGRCGQPDKKGAFALFTRAAELGDFQAQERLALAYSQGDPCEPNQELAAFWRAKAEEIKRAWKFPWQQPRWDQRRKCQP